MRWAVFDTGPEAAALAAAMSLPLVTGADTGTADGMLLAGDDAALAAGARSAAPTIPILFVPARTSDLARMFRFDQQPLARRMQEGSPYPADLGIVTGTAGELPFVAHAVASRSGRLPPWWARRRPVVVKRDGRPHEHLTTTVVIANAQHLDGTTIAPRAAVMDGRAEVQIFEGGPRARAAARRLMPRGLHLRHPSIHRRSFASLEIVAPAQWRLEADGRDAGPGPWRVRVEAAAYTLWV